MKQWIVQNPDIFKDTEFAKDAVIGPLEGEQVAVVFLDKNKDLEHARLIAAAPDLKLALEKVNEIIYANGLVLGSDEYFTCRQLIANALARTRGE